MSPEPPALAPGLGRSAPLPEKTEAWAVNPTIRGGCAWSIGFSLSSDLRPSLQTDGARTRLLSSANAVGSRRDGRRAGQVPPPRLLLPADDRGPIRLCLGGEWVERLDFETLEKVSERLLSPELLRREQDVLWRLRCHPSDDPKEEDWFYVYLHVEHRSTPRKRMALDTTVYKLLALQDLARRGKLTRRGKLPSIFTLVFYTGEAGWHAPTTLLDLVEEVPGVPEGVDLWSYVLVDAQRQPLEELLGSDSPLVALFRLERLRDPGELSEVALELERILAEKPEDVFED
ncbi:MAG TPA: Rpn family recombination-promoting nuclease/putative transposase [Thermoanaerobaculia bacterium]